MPKHVNRRRFLKGAAVSAGAAFALPTIVPSSVMGGTPPNGRVRVGHIGVGGQGGGLLGGFLGLPMGQSVAICDPIKDRREGRAANVEKHYASRADKGTYKGCKPYGDFREMLARDDIDAVVVATPDHWHVPIALAAVKAGKDVYVEKPLGISVAHNKALREAVHRYGAIFQYGTSSAASTPNAASPASWSATATSASSRPCT